MIGKFVFPKETVIIYKRKQRDTYVTAIRNNISKILENIRYVILSVIRLCIAMGKPKRRQRHAIREYVQSPFYRLDFLFRNWLSMQVSYSLPATTLLFTLRFYLCIVVAHFAHSSTHVYIGNNGIILLSRDPSWKHRFIIEENNNVTECLRGWKYRNSTTILWTSILNISDT